MSEYILPATAEANHSIHPATKLVPRPKPMRAKLYAPPALGMAELSSAKLIAVKIASKPLSANVSMTPPGPAWPVVMPIPMNTPAPIIIPIPIIVMWNRFSSRDSSEEICGLSAIFHSHQSVPCGSVACFVDAADYAFAPDNKAYNCTQSCDQYNNADKYFCFHILIF